MVDVPRTKTGSDRGTSARALAARARRRLRTAAYITGALVRSGRLPLLFRPGRAPRDLEESERQLVAWTRRAFEVARSGGASAGYHIVEGWDAPYPEVTGYFVPTLLRLADRRGSAELRGLAVMAGRWLGATRLANGAICRGQLRPGDLEASIFNTAQVIDGWCALYACDGDSVWMDWAITAGDWIIRAQEPEGEWVRWAFNEMPHTYYARVAWPLAVLGRLTGAERFVDAARRHLDWVTRQQDRDGWFRLAGFAKEATATTHTIGYVLEGLVEGGVVLGEARYIDAGERGAAALMRQYRDFGILPGELAPGWRSRAGWRCLTGETQIALLWARLGAVMGDERYSVSALMLTEDLRRTQRITDDWPEISGALSGSFPLWGDYDPYRYPTHGAKFMLDALLELRP